MRMRLVPIIVVLLLLALLTSAYQPLQPQPWRVKVDAWVLEHAASGPAEFLVELTSQADLRGAADLSNKAEKGTYVTRALQNTARRTQLPLLAHLQSLGLPHRSYWIVNLVWVRGGIEAVRSLAERPDVAHIYANPRVELDAPVEQSLSSLTPEAIEWNIDYVNAPEVWALGYTGQDVVIGGADTGYEWDHPALINQYRGWDGVQADHNYNWFDATAEASLTPVDPYGHGTHTMGIMVGDDGLGNQIGMAPGARWMGCRNMDSSGKGTPETYIACYQWFVAPTDLQGVNPDSSKAPDVINNSWGCPVSEGCTDPNVLLEAVQAVRAAGILTTHSAGNSGPKCSTVETPAGIYDESFTVGATTVTEDPPGYFTETLASYSSRGPVTVDESGRMKPDVAAPGSSIRSAYRNGSYAVMSGTSMAAPHVAGLVALLISAQPDLRGQIEQLETLIESTALPTASTECSSEGVPNNLYGWGRIDALASVSQLALHTLTLTKVASTEVVEAGGTITYTISLTHQHSLSPTLGVVLTDTIPAGTVFVSASQPYTLQDEEVRWDFGSLQAGETVQVALIVQVEQGWVDWVVNEQYAAWSLQVTQPVFGLPVYTAVETVYMYRLPLSVKNYPASIP